MLVEKHVNPEFQNSASNAYERVEVVSHFSAKGAVDEAHDFSPTLQTCATENGHEEVLELLRGYIPALENKSFTNH